MAPGPQGTRFPSPSGGLPGDQRPAARGAARAVKRTGSPSPGRVGPGHRLGAVPHPAAAGTPGQHQPLQQPAAALSQATGAGIFSPGARGAGTRIAWDSGKGRVGGGPCGGDSVCSCGLHPASDQRGQLTESKWQNPTLRLSVAAPPRGCDQEKGQLSSQRAPPALGRLALGGPRP